MANKTAGGNDWLGTILIDPATGIGYSLASLAAPSSTSTVALTPNANTTASGSQIAKASAGNLYGLNVVSGASAGYLMIFDSATVPADGTVQPKKVLPLAANTGVNQSFNPPLRFNTGIVIVFSTTGPFTKTISATAFIESEVV